MFSNYVFFAILLGNAFLHRTAIADNVDIAGYEARFDVTEHLQLDLDMLAISEASATSNFQGALEVYKNGSNSMKSETVFRTIKAFSNNDAKLEGEKWYDIYVDYWDKKGIYEDSAAYADSFTTSACSGTGQFAVSESPIIAEIARTEGCVKGAQYQNVFMYVIHEMEAAILDCHNDVIGKHWDEAVAFYTGSLVSVDSSIGVMQFSLAEKRCENFGTCTGGDDDDLYKSEVNAKVFSLFEAGRDYGESSGLADKCQQMERIKEDLVAQFMIPLVQGTLRYLYLASTTGDEKARAELWSFAAAILPMVDYYDEDAANLLYTNSLLTNDVFVPSGFVGVKSELENIYGDLGISCNDVGGLVSTTFESGYYPGMEPCSDSSNSIDLDDDSVNSNDSGKSKKKSDDDDKGLTNAAVALIVVFTVAAVGICVFAGYWWNLKKSGHCGDNSRLGEHVELQESSADGIHNVA